jgi:transposase InsO family protein
MGWQEASIVEQRFEFVTLANAQGATIAEVCRRFGISRQTGYKWLARFRQQKKEGLSDRSRRPLSSPEKCAAEVEASVLTLRDAHPAWGGRKLRARLLTLGKGEVPAASTITAILRRNGRLVERPSGPPATQRFERASPNELWQMDFKGHVPMHRGGRCHPLTILDDHSRYSIGLFACGDEQMWTVRERLVQAFRRYGLPERMLCDNGPPWGVPRGMGRHTVLTVWLLRLGVVVSHGRPQHPQTQGKEERFHRTLKAELLSRQDLVGLSQAQRCFDAWRDVYNLERPSEALGMAVPASRYKPSARAYSEKLPELEFSPEDDRRRVKHDGSLSYRNRTWFIGQAFAFEHVGVREVNDGVIEVRYGPHVVGTLQPHQGRDYRGRTCQ